MSRYSGKKFKGAGARERETKRKEAEARNVGGSALRLCGHKHGPGSSACPDKAATRLLRAIFGGAE